MPIFARIRLNLKFRPRSVQRYRSDQKIFIELGDTAPQSWTHFENLRKIPDPSTAGQGNPMWTLTKSAQIDSNRY